MNIKDFKVGQTVWVELVGDARRGKTDEQCIEEWEIASVGRKYIKAAKKYNSSSIHETTFEFDECRERFSQKTRFSADYILYMTRQEIEEKREKNRLFREIEERFRYGSRKDISLEQLREIGDILKKGETKL